MKKILLFGFDALPEILTAAGIARRFDAEAVTVSREGCGLTLAALSQGQTAGGAGLAVGGKRWFSADWSGNWTICWQRCTGRGSCA